MSLHEHAAYPSVPLIPKTQLVCKEFAQKCRHKEQLSLKNNAFALDINT